MPTLSLAAIHPALKIAVRFLLDADDGHALDRLHGRHDLRHRYHMDELTARRDERIVVDERCRRLLLGGRSP